MCTVANRLFICIGYFKISVHELPLLEIIIKCPPPHTHHPSMYCRCIWGEPEWAPHLRDVWRFCLHVDIYMCVSYILPCIPIWSCENGRCSWTVQYSQQTASNDMVIAWNKDNLQVTPLLNAHRNTTKISQQRSHFRIIIQKCVWWRIAY